MSDENGSSALTQRRLFAYAAGLCCLLSLVDGAIQQTQMSLFAGHIIFGNSVLKLILLVIVFLGCVEHPTVDFTGVPVYTWLLCIGFLLLDSGYLSIARGMSIGDVFLTYYDYYLMLLIGPVLLVFRGAVREKRLITIIVSVFLVCAAVGFAQYATGQALLPTESADGSFSVASWDFLGEVRAFSLFGSALEFGTFCTFCGALGIALIPAMPIRGVLLFVFSALACFTTLTRLCYLIFLCAACSAVFLTFGKKARRTMWLPPLYFVLGIAVMAAGVNSLIGGSSNLQYSGSLLERLSQWSYYYDLLAHSTVTERMLGLGIVQNPKILPLFPMTIDNSPLALILHIGVVGAVFFSILVFQMWVHLRREAASSKRPFVIASASLWSTLACAGIFNIVFASFGSVFALVVLCQQEKENKRQPPPGVAALQ